MAKYDSLNIKQIVWAKVDPYPWWPAKIIQKISQKKQNIFKVSFFADPTYAFLHESSIRPFFCAREQFLKDSLNDARLLKAIKQADAQIANKYLEKIIESTQVLCENESSEFQKNIEEEKVCEQNQKIIQNDVLSKQVQPVMQNELKIDDLTVDNVYIFLQNLQKNYKKLNYSYQKRKEEIIFKDHLRFTLLQRYNLNKKQQKKNIFKIAVIQSQTLQNKQTKNKFIFKKKINKQDKYRKTDSFTIIYSQALRKLYATLKNKKQQNQKIKQLSVNMINKLKRLSQENILKFKSLFITLMKTIDQSSTDINTQQKLQDFNNFIQKLQSQKNQDWQGSRVTQMQNTS